MSLVTVITGSLTWVCPNCGWREKYVEPKTIDGMKWDLSPNESILCTYKGVVDGKHLFVPVTQGEIEVKDNEKYYIKELRELIVSAGGDSEIFHSLYDNLLTEIIKKFGFKEFFDVLDREYKGQFWAA